LLCLDILLGDPVPEIEDLTGAITELRFFSVCYLRTPGI
jgi:hypothetical protein